MNRIADDKRVAFAGRLKMFQKVGLIDTAKRPGRGKAGTYTFPELMRFVIATEFIQAGMQPNFAAKLVTGSWYTLLHSLYSCSLHPEETIGFTEKPTEYLWMISPESLRGLSVEGEGEHDHRDRIWVTPIKEAIDLLTKGVGSSTYGEQWRTTILNGTSLTREVMRLISFQFKYADFKEMRAQIMLEIAELNENAREFVRRLETPPTPEEAEQVRLALEEVKHWDFSNFDKLRGRALVERAEEMVRLLPPHLSDLLRERHGEGDGVTFDDETIRELLALELAEIDEVPHDNGGHVQGLVTTDLGFTVIKMLRGQWRDEPDELDRQANKLLRRLTTEQVALLCTHPMVGGYTPEDRQRFLKLGIIEIIQQRSDESGELVDAWRFSDLGEAIRRMALATRRQLAKKEKADGNG